MTRLLHVFMQGKAVGKLRYDADEDLYQFDYVPGWAASRNAIPLSPALPFGSAPPDPEAVRRYLDNLLPEGRALDVAAHFAELSKNDTFGLIHALGKEPVGAFSFLALDTDDEIAAQIAREQVLEPVRRTLDNEHLGAMLRECNTVPFIARKGESRRSIACDQDRLQVLAEGEHLSLVDGALSSTHWLKPESLDARMPHLVANEYFCTGLAARLGLPTTPVSIRRIPEPVLLVERFDRSIMWDADARSHVHAVRRLHVIDGCQALDLPASLKYQHAPAVDAEVREIREGASFARLFGLLNQMVTPATARLFLLRWAVLQLLLGNGNAHARTISFFVQPAGLSPAPLQDLVSTQAYGAAVHDELAMAYGEAFRTADISALELARFASQTGTPPAQLAREITRMADAALKFAPQLAADEIYLDEERRCVQAVADWVCAQADRLRELAPAIRKAMPRLA